MAFNKYLGYVTSTGAGGDCDYPLEANVRAGIVYAFETKTGTLQLPESTVGEAELAHNNLKNNIAASSTFQDWTGSADYLEALDDIYINSVGEDSNLTEKCPYALILHSDISQWERVGFGVNDTYDESGMLQVNFESAIDISEEADSIEAQQSTIVLKCDRIMKEALSYSGIGGYLAISNCSRQDAYVSDEADEYQIITVEYKLDWR